MPREASCAERLPEHLASRLEDFRAMETRERRASATDNDDRRDALYTEVSEYPLAVTVHRVWRIDISTGGPGDWIEVHTDDDNDPTRVEYHFQDWFDHASVALDGEERDAALWFARQVTADFYVEEARPERW